jgi:hypothetical protein
MEFQIKPYCFASDSCILSPLLNLFSSSVPSVSFVVQNKLSSTQMRDTATAPAMPAS